MEEEVQKLRKENQRLSGKLGAQGSAIHREERYQSLQKQLNDAYEEIEKLELERVTLRDKFAAKAMQGILSNPIEMREIFRIVKRDGKQAFSLCETAYFYADKMLKARESTKQE